MFFFMVFFFSVVSFFVRFFFFSSRRRHTRWPRDWSFRRVLFRSWRICSPALGVGAVHALKSAEARVRDGGSVARRRHASAPEGVVVRDRAVIQPREQ